MRMSHTGGGKGGTKGPMRRVYTEEISEGEEELSPVELIRPVDEEETINFLDGYRKFSKRFSKHPTPRQLALRMESYLGRYINPERIAQGESTHRAPPGQSVQIKWGRSYIELEVSLEKPARDNKRRAREHKVRVPWLRHQDGSEATDMSIGGREKLELFSGTRALAEVKKLKIYEERECKEIAIIGNYQPKELQRRIEWTLGYMVNVDSAVTEDGKKWNGEVQDGGSIYLPKRIQALLVYRNQEALV
jgi:hypothetical protein